MDEVRLDVDENHLGLVVAGVVVGVVGVVSGLVGGRSWASWSRRGRFVVVRV